MSQYSTDHHQLEPSRLPKSVPGAPNNDRDTSIQLLGAPNDVELFLRASELERNGHVSKAIKLYEQAYRLNPDVEKVASEHENTLNTFAHSPTSNIAARTRPKFQITVPGLIEEIRSSICNDYQPMGLPTEIMMRVLAWVGILHTPSLEECAKSCKRLYLLSRDDTHVWRKIIGHTRAARQGKLYPLVRIPSNLSSYRQMYFEAPRVRTDGMYICKISYFRPGVTDGAFFQPIHMVTYYRYLRFFGEAAGYQVVLVVSTEEPKAMVPLLKAPVQDNLALNIPFGMMASDLVPGYKQRRQWPTIKLPSFTKANVFLGRYFRHDHDWSKFRLTLFDPQSNHCSLVQMQMAIVSGKRNGVLICDQDFTVSPPSRPDADPITYHFDISEWGNFIFSRVRSYLT